jgi:hypothetical protein
MRCTPHGMITIVDDDPPRYRNFTDREAADLAADLVRQEPGSQIAAALLDLLAPIKGGYVQ